MVELRLTRVIMVKKFFTKVESSVHREILGCCDKPIKLLGDQIGDRRETNDSFVRGEYSELYL